MARETLTKPLFINGFLLAQHLTALEAEAAASETGLNNRLFDVFELTDDKRYPNLADAGHGS